MKKLNNKGFAITTVIYGLSILGILLISILMATMSTTRSNTSQLAKSIEEELNRFSKTETSFSYQMVDASSDVPISQEYIVPEGQSGFYRIELWGAQGGGANGGYGAYTSGVIRLNEGDVLYFYVGKHQSSNVKGGRESDVRIVSGGYSDAKSYNTRIMVAAGGGTTAGAAGGTLYGYTSDMTSQGGYISVSGASKNYGLLATGGSNPTNGSLVGYPSSYATAKFGVSQATVNGPTYNGKGGDGYYPSNTEKSGGTSYIAGYLGSISIEKGSRLAGAAVHSRFDYYEYLYNEDTDTYYYTTNKIKSYYFYDGMMYAGVNAGDGRARIERLVVTDDSTTSLPRKNTKLNGIKFIRDCVDGGVASQIIARAGETEYRPALQNDGSCKRVSLGSTAVNVDEIAVFHSGLVGTNLKNHRIEVSKDGTNWTPIKKATAISETETVTGIHISAYQFDSTEYLPTSGNYYIVPVLSENKAVTANLSAAVDSNPIKIEYINGYKRQKWEIEVITNKSLSSGYVAGNTSTYEYKIIELARYKSMSIYQDENIANNQISANDSFNSYARNEPQIWKIVPMGDGTYTISTVVSSFDSVNVTGNILPQTNQKVDDNKNTLIIGKNNTQTARFKIISIDYSSS